MVGDALTDQFGSRRAVLQRLLTVLDSGTSALLAVVVSTEGSTYRKRGAVALVETDGRQTGVLSGGCLEAGFRSSALAALKSGSPDWLLFDSLDDADLLFGSGSGCRGRSRVLLWPLSSSESLLARLRGLLDGRQSLRLDPAFGADGVIAQPEWLDAPSGQSIELRPPPRLWIVGAGPEVPALLWCLRSAGWVCLVSEHRQGWAAAADLALADQLLPLRPAAAGRSLLPVHTMLIMSHAAETDLQALRLAAGADVRAVGLLGPPRRRDELLAQLTPTELEQLEPRLVAPVGLKLGGEGPLAIAMSIAAWLQQAFPDA